MRDTMAILVARLRRVTDAASDDIFRGVTYWTDDQLEAALDAHAEEVDLKLVSCTRLVNNAVEWRRKSFEYDLGYGFEDEPLVVDSKGYTVLYSAVNWERKLVTIDPTVALDDTMYLRCNRYDVWKAAADVWNEKAQQRTDYVNWKVINERVDMEQEYNHCIRMRDHYNGLRVRGFDW